MSRQRRRPARDVHGILLLDKPAGITSNEALQRAKRLFQARKAGHTGSLDRLASGLLPLCFGEATKFSSYLLDADKHYLATCSLGTRTNTGDAAGEVLETRPVPDLSTERIEQVLERFRGDIEQVPPMFSALKHQGKRLYELAYEGKEVERRPRPVRIHRLDLLRFEGAQIDIDVICSKGTYIRTLGECIGEVLGCGAHISALRRVGAGPFSHPRMYRLEELERLASDDPAGLDRVLLSIDAVLDGMPAVTLSESVAYYLRQGQAVVVPHAPTAGVLRLYNDAQAFLGIGEVLDDGRVSPRRLVATQ